MKKKVDAVAKNLNTKKVSKKAPAAQLKKSALKPLKKSAAQKTAAKKSSAKTAAASKTSTKKVATSKAKTQKTAAQATGVKAKTSSGTGFGGKVAAVIAATDLALTLAKKLSQPKKAVSIALPQIAPLHHRVVVRPAPRAEKTAGGLYIPESTEHKPLQGTVVAVGLGKVMKKGAVRPMDVQNGDTILYAPYAGTDVQLEGEQFLILTEDEILGVLND